MFDLILPCAGQSTRFGGRPKWMLTHPTGKLMFQMAVDGLSKKHLVRSVVMVVLREHLISYGFSEDDLIRAIRDCGFESEVKIVAIESSSSQVESVMKGIDFLPSGGGAILVKDCDNYWDGEYTGGNEIFGFKVTQGDDIRRLQQKSFIRYNDNGLVKHMDEKQITSDVIGVGGYGFRSAAIFLLAQSQNKSEKTLSGLVNWMLANGETFLFKPALRYQDWGTHQEWADACKQYKNLIVDLDGVLVVNSAQYFGNYKWGQSPPLNKNLDHLKAMVASGKVFLILLTARPESFRATTEAQLKAMGLTWQHLIMGCHHATRVVVNDYGPGSYPSAMAINLKRDSDGQLADLMP